MLKSSLAILIATLTPASAANNALTRHEVHYEDQTFICGSMRQGGKIRRFIQSIPPAKYIPEYEPPAGDPLAPSWMITYRIICEGGNEQPSVTAHLNRRRVR